MLGGVVDWFECGAVGIERACGPLDEAALVIQQHNDAGEHLLL